MFTHLDDETALTHIYFTAEEKELILDRIVENIPKFITKLNAETEQDRKELRLSMLYRLKGLEIKVKHTFNQVGAASYGKLSLTRGQLGIALNLIAKIKTPTLREADLFAVLLQATYPEKDQANIKHERARYLEKTNRVELYQSPFSGKMV